MRRKTEADYYELAKSRGFKWVGPVLPKDNKDPTWWECKKGDRWETTYNRIQQGDGCPVCYGTARKTEKDYHELAESRGFKWVDDRLPKNTHDPTWWECEKGDKWKARYNDIYTGSGCSVCSGNIRKTEKDYNNLAKSRGFKWAGEVLPKNTGYSTLWERENGDRWKARYDDIKQGNCCSVSKNRINGVLVSKPQRELNIMLFGSLNHPEGRRRIDVAIMRSSQKIAVEYDCWYWHKGNEKRETKRDKYLINKGWKILHVKAGVLLPTRKQLTTAIGYLLKTDDKVYNLYLEDWK